MEPLSKMQLIIVSGYSGAGKSQAASILEDDGFYCVDNLPPELIPQFVLHCQAAQAARYEKVVLVTDVRSGLTFDGLFSALAKLDELGQPYRILFMEASPDVIVQRYKENRRKHPLVQGEGLVEAVQRERELLQPIRNRANTVIDTTNLSVSKLRGYVLEAVSGDQKDLAMSVNVVSFGFKHGLPLDADLVFDVRFLPNPYYVQALRNHTGRENCVREYIYSYQQTRDYVEKVKALLDFSMPYYAHEGKTELVIAFGCTGGHHRSVALACDIAEHTAKRGYQTTLSHRDLGRH